VINNIITRNVLSAYKVAQKCELEVWLVIHQVRSC